MGIILRNISGSALPVDDLGIELLTGADYDIAQFPPQQIHMSGFGGDLETVINANSAVILDPVDDTTEMSLADSLLCVRSMNLPHFRNATGGTALAGTIPLDWEFKDEVAAADPGSGNFRYNNAVLASVTAIYVDDET